MSEKETIEMITDLEKALSNESDMFKKFDIADKIIDLKRSINWISAPKQGEDCLGCGS